jgi:hypothetical protein
MRIRNQFDTGRCRGVPNSVLHEARLLPHTSARRRANSSKWEKSSLRGLILFVDKMGQG